MEILFVSTIAVFLTALGLGIALSNLHSRHTATMRAYHKINSRSSTPDTGPFP